MHIYSSQVMTQRDLEVGFSPTKASAISYKMLIPRQYPPHPNPGAINWKELLAFFSPWGLV